MINNIQNENVLHDNDNCEESNVCCSFVVAHIIIKVLSLFIC